MTLPLIPGYSFRNDIGRTSFKKLQKFSYENKIPMEIDQLIRFPKLRSYATEAVRPDAEKPAWEAFDKYVLCFNAIFHETVREVSPIEKYRFRRCKIYYFLEDDTMQIVEDNQRNSGILQGTILSRQRFKKPKYECNGEFYTLHDLNIGLDLEIYGRLYKVTNCDRFTRQFLTEIGKDVNDPVPEPADPYTDHRRHIEHNTAARKPFKTKDKLGQFLNFHPHALRFFCLWDDTVNLYGSKRKMVLTYFLDDDTVEVSEDRDINSGRSDTKVLLKRSFLPKHVESLVQPGELVGRTVLNTAGIRGNMRHYALDNNPLSGRDVEFYKDEDFDLGKIVNVWGREFLVYDCDDFTKNFYKMKYGRELTPVKICKEVKAIPQRIIPKEYVFGSPEDSIQSCKKLVPKPHKKDSLKFYMYDKYGYESYQLTFAASIISDDCIKKSRKFVITFFLSDDTIQINEPHQQNTGIVDGKQMLRNRVRKPNTESSLIPVYYSAGDFFVGNVLTIKADNYLLTNADEYTYNYMESHPEIFHHSDAGFIIQKIKKWLTQKCAVMSLYFKTVDIDGTGFVDFDVFRRTIYDSLPEDIGEQEVITLARYYADMEDVDIRWDEVLSMAQTELRKKNYNDYDNLSLALQEFDVDKIGFFTKEKLYIHLKSCRLPLSSELIKAFLYKFPNSSKDCIEYQNVLSALNYFENPVPVWAPQAGAIDINWKKIIKIKSLGRINYVKFIEDMEPIHN